MTSRIHLTLAAGAALVVGSLGAFASSQQPTLSNLGAADRDAKTAPSRLGVGTPAAMEFYNGAGINFPGFFEATPAVIGTDWESVVVLFHSAEFTAVTVNFFGHFPPGAAVFNGPLLYGEFLNNRRPITRADVGLINHSFAVPNDPALIGERFSSQGMCFSFQAGVLAITLMNGLDITIGDIPPIT